MPKIKMKTILASPKYTCRAGGVIDVDTDTAKQLVDGGCAEYVKAPVPEKRVIQPEEKAIKPEPKSPAENDVTTETRKPRGRRRG